MKNKYYLYRFLDENDNVLYIGRTNDIRRRIMMEHFTANTHLSKECYAETRKVEYSEFSNESEEVVYEAILINKIKPKYNKQFNDDAVFNVELPPIKWKPFEWDFDGQMELMKALKDETISVSTALFNVVEKCISQKVLAQCHVHGFSDIDSYAIIPPSSTTLIAGLSGTYKTSYALQIALSNARKGCKVLYVNLKDSIDSISYKLLSIESGIEINKFYTSAFTDNDWKLMLSTTEIISKLPLQFYNSSKNENTLVSIENAIINAECDLAIIDDLSAVSDFENPYSFDKYSYSANKLKEIALKNNCAIISLYSLKSKDIMTRTDKHPLLSDLPYTSLISCNDLIEFLYSYKTDIGMNYVEVNLAKNLLGKNITALLSPVNGRLVTLEMQSK